MSEKDVIKEARQRMDGAIEDFRRKLAAIRTGRAAVSILDSVVVDYYGTPTPLNQMASVHAPEPQLLTVQPWDQTQIGAVEKAIRSADLGLNPSNDGKLVRVPIPPLTVQPWDQTQIGAVEKAIRSADLGLNPSNDGKLVRVPIPPLTEERRKQLAKQMHDSAEDHRTAIRQARRDGNDRLKKMLKDKQISEDAERDALQEIQKLTDNYIGKIDELSKTKENEIMSV